MGEGRGEIRSVGKKITIEIIILNIPGVNMSM